MPWHGLGILDIMNKTEFTVCSALLLSLFNCVQLCDPIDGSPPRLPRPWDSPGKNTGVGCHSLVQRIFPTQESNQGPPSLEADSLPSEPLGKPHPLGGYIQIITKHRYSPSLQTKIILFSPVLGIAQANYKNPNEKKNLKRMK